MLCLTPLPASLSVSICVCDMCLRVYVCVCVCDAVCRRIPSVPWAIESLKDRGR